MARPALSPEQMQELTQAVAAEVNRAPQPQRGRLRLDLPTFSGAKGPLDAQGFLKDAEGYKEACGLNDGQAVQAVQFALRDVAKVWGANLAITTDLQTITWQDYKAQFERRFGLSMSPSEKAKLVEGLKQKPDESVKAFFDRCQSAELILAESNQIYRQADQPTKQRMREQGICDKFLRGLREAGDLKGAVNSMAPAQGRDTITMQEYYDAAVQKEQTLSDRRTGATPLCTIAKAPETEKDLQAKVEEVERRMAELQAPRSRLDLSKTRCFGCNQLGHTVRFCRSRGQRGRSQGARGGRGRGFGSGWRRRGGQGPAASPAYPGPRTVGALEAMRAITDTLVDEKVRERRSQEEEPYFGLAHVR